HRAGEVPLGHGEGHLGGYGGIELHEQAGEPERRYVHRAPFSDEPLNTRTATKAFLLGEGMTLHAGVVGPEGREVGPVMSGAYFFLPSLLMNNSMAPVMLGASGSGASMSSRRPASRTALLVVGPNAAMTVPF